MQSMIQHDAGILLQPDIYNHIDIPIFPYQCCDIYDYLIIRIISYNYIRTVYNIKLFYLYFSVSRSFPTCNHYSGPPSVQGSDEGGPLLTIAVRGSYRPTYLEATETGRVRLMLFIPPSLDFLCLGCF